MATTLDTLSIKILHAFEACWSPRWLLLLFVIFCSLIFRDFEATTRGLNTPVVGRWPLEPYFLTGLRFKFQSMLHLRDGYSKFKTQMFKVIRLDGMVLITPRQWVEELRSVPEHHLSLRHLQVYVKPLWMLRNRLTPCLHDFVASSLEEIRYATEKELPVNQGEWTSMTINHNLLYIVAGVTARAMSGTLLCRQRQWLSICIKYTENMFMTVLILRLFPRMFHRCMSGFLPSSWITHFYLRRAKKLLEPIIEERIKDQTSSIAGYERPRDLLQYMIEGAEGDDRQPERLAHLQLMVNLAGIHTTSMAITHAIHDLCEHEEYSKVLREESKKYS